MEQISSTVKTWRTITFIVLSISVGFYLFTQGSHVSGGSFISNETSPYTASVYGYVVLSPLLIFYYSYSFYVSTAVSSDIEGVKLPLIFDLNLPSSSGFNTKIYWLSCLIVLLLPISCLVHCYTKSLGANVYYKNQYDAPSNHDVCYKKSSDGSFYYKKLDCKEKNRKKFIDKDKDKDKDKSYQHFKKYINITEIFHSNYIYDNQITYFPFWQPWFFLFLISIVIIYWFRLIIRLLYKT